MRYGDYEPRSVGEYCAGNMYACGSSIVYVVGDMRVYVHVWYEGDMIYTCADAHERGILFRAMQCRVGAMDG